MSPGSFSATMASHFVTIRVIRIGQKWEGHHEGRERGNIVNARVCVGRKPMDFTTGLRDAVRERKGVNQKGGGGPHLGTPCTF